jgi:hypothetical protein
MFTGPKKPTNRPPNEPDWLVRRTELTARSLGHRLPSDNIQAWEAGKAVRIGHGPATVIGETP